MSKALVIKGVDFSENKLTTVTLIEEIPCTSISLNNSALTLSGIGITSTLVATVLPANTTDNVSWSSSNGRVASVSSSGVVTVEGAGSATITATCGTKTATCVVTTTVTLTIEKMLKHQIVKRGTEVGAKNAVIQIGGEQDSNYYGCGYTTTKPKATYKHIFNNGGISDVIYPIYFGCASTLTITAPSNIKVTVVITDSQHSPSEMDIDPGTAMWVMADASASDLNVPYGNRTVTNIPTAADSVGFSFRKNTDDLELTDLSNITVVAS